MARRPTKILFDPQQLSAEHAKHLSVDHYAEQQRAATVGHVDNAGFRQEAKHRMVVAEVTLKKDGSGNDLGGGNGVAVQTVLVTPPNLNTNNGHAVAVDGVALSPDFAKYNSAAGKEAFARQHYAMMKRVIANATDKSTLVFSALTGLGSDLNGLRDAGQKEEYAKAAMAAWKKAWQEHVAAGGNPTELKLYGPQDATYDNHFTWLAAEFNGAAHFEVVRQNPEDILAYVAADATNKTLAIEIPDTSIGGEHQTEIFYHSHLAKPTHSDLLEQVAAAQTEEFPEDLRSHTVLATSAPDRNLVEVVYTSENQDGELFVALGHHNHVNGKWEFPSGGKNADDYTTAAHRVLQAEMGVDVQADQFTLGGDPFIEVRNGVGRGAAQQTIQSAYLNARSDQQTALVASGAFNGGATQWVKVSDLRAANQVDGRDVNASVLQKIREIDSQHQTAKHEEQQRALAEQDRQARLRDQQLIQNPQYKIIKTKGSGHNDCGGAAVVKWIVANALNGKHQDKLFLNEADRFNLLFQTLQDQVADHNALYANARAAEIVEADHVGSFAALADLSQAEFDARAGAAVRTIIASTFRNGAADANDLAIPVLAHFKDKLLNEFARFLDVLEQEEARFAFADEFVGLTGEPLNLLEKFREIKASNSANKTTDLENWWNTTGRALYADALEQVNPQGGLPQLMHQHLALFAAKFGLKFQYKSRLEDNIGSVQNGVTAENAPTVTVHIEPGHWSALIMETVKNEYNNGKDENKQLSIDLYAQVFDEKAKEERSRSQARAQIYESYKTVTRDQVFESMTQHYQDFKPEELPDFVTQRFSRECYAPDSKVSKTLTGVELTYAFNEGNATEGSRKEFIITATKYEKPTGGPELTPEQIRLEKLNSIAAGYVDTFINTLGMDKDRLEIDLNFGEDWNEPEVIEAFKQAGFKRILVNGVEKYKDTNFDRSPEEVRQEEERQAAIRGAVPQPGAQGVSRALEVVKNNPVDAGILTLGAAATGASMMMSDSWRLPFAVMTGTAVLEAAWQAYQRGFIQVPQSVTDAVQTAQQKMGQLRAYVPEWQQLVAMTKATGGVAALGAIAHYSGFADAYMPDASSGILKMMGFQMLLGSAVSVLPHLGVGKDTAAWTGTALSKGVGAWRTWGNWPMFAMAVVGQNNLAKAVQSGSALVAPVAQGAISMFPKGPEFLDSLGQIKQLAGFLWSNIDNKTKGMYVALPAFALNAVIAWYTGETSSMVPVVAGVTSYMIAEQGKATRKAQRGNRELDPTNPDDLALMQQEQISYIADMITGMAVGSLMGQVGSYAFGAIGSVVSMPFTWASNWIYGDSSSRDFDSNHTNNGGWKGIPFRHPGDVDQVETKTLRIENVTDQKVESSQQKEPQVVEIVDPGELNGKEQLPPPTKPVQPQQQWRVRELTEDDIPTNNGSNTAVNTDRIVEVTEDDVDLNDTEASSVVNGVSLFQKPTQMPKEGHGCSVQVDKQSGMMNMVCWGTRTVVTELGKTAYQTATDPRVLFTMGMYALNSVFSTYMGVDPTTTETIGSTLMLGNGTFTG